MLVSISPAAASHLREPKRGKPRRFRRLGGGYGTEMADKANDHTPAEHHQGGVAPAAEIDRTIVLVGLMGAGKSCIGKRLAAHFSLDRKSVV